LCVCVCVCVCVWGDRGVSMLRDGVGVLCSQIVNRESFIPICQAGNLKRTSKMIEEIPWLQKNVVSHSLHGVVKNMIRKGPVTPRSVPFLSRKTVKVPVKLSGFLTVSILWATTP